MCAAIQRARRRVDLEVYIFECDELGQRFVHALCAAARRGVRVRLLVDAFGSLWGVPARVERELLAAGVAVRRFHRWRWRSPLRYNRRNHRKLLLVDEESAFMGGFNIHRLSSRELYGEARWRDTHVRLGGDLVRQASESFELFWQGRRERHLPIRLSAEQVLLSNHNLYARRRLRRVFDAALNDARRRIWLTNPYFVPDHRMQGRLVRAARRGVDVRVLLPGKSDVRLARWASHAAYTRLLEGGVRIYEYLPRMLHAKTAVVDGDWASVGTSNLDYRSVFLNYEINLVSRSATLCAALEQQFLADMTQSEEIPAERWGRRHWGHYAAEAIGWWARRWL
ncbi:cardiolipin synthase B [Alkalilimnicola sp. S0819]|nr:cardiolipin synthase B [Alkalilimnicola sp. S0819]MPQ17302.1 cardiolipin synthase B [Alkalilimnicola sp. S0819]